MELSILTLPLADALLALLSTGLTGLYIQRCVSAYSSTARVSIAVTGGGRGEILAGSHRECFVDWAVEMFTGTWLGQFSKFVLHTISSSRREKTGSHKVQVIRSVIKENTDGYTAVQHLLTDYRTRVVKVKRDLFSLKEI